MSCVKEQQEVVDVLPDAPVFYATLESSGDPDTRVYADDQLRVRWDVGDHISIFNKGTANQEYAFQGETGDNSGAFTKASGGSSATSSGLDLIYAVYPYQETTTMTDDGEITLTLPATQSYRENSFGLGANTMISVTEDNELHFKNLCGYFAVKLYGDNVSVSSISLKGNNNECLAGKATVVASADGFPTLQFDSADAVKELTLNLDTPVKIGSSSETATTFCFVIPPTIFEKGVTLTVQNIYNDIFSKEASSLLEIKRNTLSEAVALKSEFMPYNKIYYTSTDGQVVMPKNSYDFGAIIVSNVYQDSIGIITFNKDVTHIGASEFKDCSTLCSITLPNSVTSIGVSAFKNCSSLTNITIPAGVSTIAEETFSNCSCLTSLSLPDGVTSIGGSAFSYCASLTSINIPEGVTSIGGSAFYRCVSLTSINIPEGVTSIGGHAFYYCSSLNSIIIPKSVTSIGHSAFYACSGLCGIMVLPDSPPSGSYYMFDYTNSIIVVPAESVENYKSASFWSNYASRITAFTTDPNSVIYYTSTDGNIIKPWANYCDAHVIFNGMVNGQGMIRFDGVLTVLGLDTFSRCRRLSSIILPESVTVIGGAFEWCDSLKRVNIPAGVTTIGGHAFKDCHSLSSLVLPAGLKSIGASAFSYCSSLTGDLSIPDGITIIESGTFSDCRGLTSINIPEGVTSIGGSAFSGCASLTSINIPEGVTSIGGSAFSGCASLTSINIPDGVTNIGENAFSGCSKLTSFTIPKDVTSIERATFWDCSSLTSVSIPDRVTSIGYMAFSGCSSLTNVSIPEGVTSIGEESFYGCSSLTNISIPDGVTSIENGTFCCCEKLVDVTIPNSVERIGKLAFADCFSLNSINLPQELLSIGERAFRDCRSLSIITIPDTITSLEYGTFAGCKSLNSIIIPENITSIGEAAFALCSSLSNVTIPSRVNSIGERAFIDCSQLSDITVLPVSPPSGGSKMFDNTNNAPIHVPAESVDAYKTAEYWSNYSSRIKAISQ